VQLHIREDLKQACRQMAAHPGYTLVTLLTLALGTGANTAIFSVARGVLLRPLPYAHGGALVHIVPRIPGAVTDQLYFPVPEALDYRRQTKTLAAVVEYHSMSCTLLGNAGPDRIQTGVVSADFFGAFGVVPLLGRDFRPDDDRPGADPVMLLTYDYWRQRFGGDRGIVGRRLRMNDRPILVVGVLPRLPAYPGKDQLFMPSSSCPFRAQEDTKSNRGVRFLDLWGLLRPGVGVARARADTATIAARLGRDYPDPVVRGMTLSLVPVSDELVGAFRPRLLILLGTAGLVLLIACANAANLTSARLLGRRQEVVMRAALGASRVRLVRQLLTESLLTALLGGLLGSVLAWVALGLLVAFARSFTPRTAEIRIDGVVLLFSLGLSLAAGLLAGWMPAVQALRHDLAASLKEGPGRATAGGGGRRFRDLMVAAQVGVSFVLLIGAALMVRSLVRLFAVDPGLRPERVLTATLELPLSKYGTDAQRESFFRRLLAALAADPTVAAAAVSSDVPMANAEPMTPSYRVEGEPAPPGSPLPRGDLHVASEEYFRVLGIPLMEGRAFRAQDDEQAPKVVIVNQEVARRWWPGRSPVGRRVGLDSVDQTAWRTIVGVVGDVRQEGLAAPARPAFYVPYLQMIGPGAQLFVRTRTAPVSVLPGLRAAVAAIDREQPVANVATLEQVRSLSLAPARLTTSLLLLFAGLAAAITGIGISAAASFAVAERIPEVAIRIAVGAGGGSILTLLLWRALAPVAAGLACGLAAAIALTRLLGGLLYDVGPLDPLALFGALLVLLAIALITCSVPSLRAIKVDPVAVLRT